MTYPSAPPGERPTHVMATDRTAGDKRYVVDSCRTAGEAGEVVRYVRERTDPARWHFWTTGYLNGEPAWDRKAHMHEPDNATGTLGGENA